MGLKHPDARKTISVRELIDEVNRRNRNSVCSPEVRKGWNSLLETILFRSDSYDGFSYLRAGEVPADQKPGIIFDHSEARAHVFPDETRVHYYIAAHLRKPGE